MSNLYQFETPRMVAERIKTGKVDEDWAVVDVRDSDHIGGHIPGSHHEPSTSFGARCEGLVADLAGVKTVIFHCGLSQERGPRAARLYAQMRADKLAQGAPVAAQEVVVLQGGFKLWSETFKQDGMLVEGYNSALW